jgi:hypothetical protein
MVVSADTTAERGRHQVDTSRGYIHPDSEEALMPDIELYRGDTDSFVMHLRQNNKPIDVTAETITAAFRELPGAAPLFILTVGNGITKTDPGNGQISLDFASSLTAPFATSKALSFDVQLLNGASQKRTVFQGTCLVRADIAP